MKRIRNKKVSVIIATYNPLRTLSLCMLSIKKQTYKPIEVIVVDSKDYDKSLQQKTKQIVKQYGKYIQDGPERSIQRNRGIKEANGEFILVIDQDMYLADKVVEECVEMIERKKLIALNIPELSIGEGFWTNAVALERYVSTYLENGMNECCRFFRKTDAIAIGGYDPTIVGVEDSDFHYRIEKKGKIGKIRNHILHDEGRTTFWGRVKKKYYYSRAFKKYLERYPEIAAKQFFPIKRAYFIHWKEFAKKPLVTIGVIILRSGEVAAGIFGILIKKNEA